MTKPHILLVEDDTSMGFLLIDFLESNNFEVKLYADGNASLKAFNDQPFDFCILDVMLPGMDGFSIAEKIREKNQIIPIMFLTARSQKIDKIKGFNLGVDDYMTKPFDEDELLCRIQAILNRAKRGTNESPKSESLNFKINSFTYDVPNHLLIHANGNKRLTPKESDVLCYLCQHQNNVVKRDDILQAIWGNTDYFNGRSLDVFITKLRKCFASDSSISIENIPTVGFVLKTV